MKTKFYFFLTNYFQRTVTFVKHKFSCISIIRFHISRKHTRLHVPLLLSLYSVAGRLQRNAVSFGTYTSTKKETLGGCICAITCLHVINNVGDFFSFRFPPLRYGDSRPLSLYNFRLYTTAVNVQSFWTAIFFSVDVSLSETTVLTYSWQWTRSVNPACHFSLYNQSNFHAKRDENIYISTLIYLIAWPSWLQHVSIIMLL